MVAPFDAANDRYKARHTPRPDLWDDEPGDHVAGPGRPPFDPDRND